MDYRKIIEDLMDEGNPVDEELRLAAAAFIRELLAEKLELTSELTLAKKCLAENEEAYDQLLSTFDESKAEAEAERYRHELLRLTLFPFIPGMRWTTSVEDPGTMYLDLPDGPRLVFHEGKYAGYVAEVAE